MCSWLHCHRRWRQVAIPFADETPALATINEFYSLSDFMYPEAFVGLELPRPPEPAHINKRLVPEPPHIASRYLWQYHYLATFFGHGSHYIVLEHPNDAPDLTMVGSFGYVCANGQGESRWVHTRQCCGAFPPVSMALPRLWQVSCLTG